MTAGNASGLNDGAAALLVASESAIKELGWRRRRATSPSAAAGVEPSYMGLGPVPGVKKALAQGRADGATY